MMRFVQGALVLLLAIGTGYHCGSNKVHEKAEPASAAAALGQRSAAIPGVCYAHNWRSGGLKGYGTASSQASLTRLQKLGTRSISYTPFGWVGDENAPLVEVRSGGKAGESDASIIADAKLAKELGLQIMLKPHLWVSHDVWSGDLSPKAEQWPAFAQSYRAFALHYAKLATKIGADYYAIGNEMKAVALARPDFFRTLASDVRREYKGQISYCANWDAALDIAFWDAVDLIAVNEYTPLSQNPEASDAELARGAASIVASIEALSAKHDKQVIVSEFGFRSTPASFVKPWGWPEKEEPSGDQEAQRRAYNALIPVLLHSPAIHSIYLWKWFSDSKDEEPPGDFSPAGKLAEKALEKLYREQAAHIEKLNE